MMLTTCPSRISIRITDNGTSPPESSSTLQHHIRAYTHPEAIGIRDAQLPGQAFCNMAEVLDNGRIVPGSLVALCGAGLRQRGPEAMEGHFNSTKRPLRHPRSHEYLKRSPGRQR